MTFLRERLQAGDPARTARPLDADEVAAIRRAMQWTTPEARRWHLVAAFAVAVTGLAAALLLLLWPDAAPPAQSPAPAPVAVAPPAPVKEAAPAPTPPVLAEARPPRRRQPAVLAPPIAPTTVKEIRFVTASGTQILWTFRSTEEGA